MRRLRRSVLLLDATASGPRPWPPPDADSVPDAALIRPRGGPREALAEAAAELARWGVDCTLDAEGGDFEEWAWPGLSSVVCRAATPQEVAALDARLAEFERSAGLDAGSVRIELLIDSAAAALNVRATAGASPRVASVMTAPSLLREALGVEHSAEVDALAFPRGELVLAAAAHGLEAVGRFEPAGHHRRTVEGMDAAGFSFATGLHGGLCAGWDDVAACNRGFAPDEAAVDRAHRIIEAMENAAREGLGAVSLDGRMIDIPFIRLAERLLELAARAAERRSAVDALVRGDG